MNVIKISEIIEVKFPQIERKVYSGTEKKVRQNIHQRRIQKKSNLGKLQSYNLGNSDRRFWRELVEFCTAMVKNSGNCLLMPVSFQLSKSSVLKRKLKQLELKLTQTYLRFNAYHSILFEDSRSKNN